MTSTTVNITSDMQKLLNSVSIKTRDNLHILPTTYTCQCGESTYNDAEIYLFDRWTKMPHVTECAKCSKRKAQLKENRAKVQDKWAHSKLSEIVTSRHGLYLHGSFGVGKTYAVKRLHTVAKYTDISTRITTPQAIQRAFNDCIASDIREEQILAELSVLDVLIIDDIGQEQVTERGLSQLWQVINRRYELHRPCVYTSNYTLSALTARYASVNRIQAESISSRIAGSCEQREVTGEDKRLMA